MTKTLTNMLPADYSLSISVLDKGEKSSLPDWAATMIWLGSWCRLNQQAGKRLIVFVVLPTRALAAPFAGLGCLIAGSSVFENSISWPKFKKMQPGESVFWLNKNTGVNFSGKIAGFREHDGNEFIIVKVTNASKNRKSHVGSIIEINQRYFDDYRFKEEKPPTLPKAVSLDAVMHSLKAIVQNIDPKWIWADGSEGLLITNLAIFESSIEGLSLSIDCKSAISISDMLCFGRNDHQNHAKIRIDHPRGELEGNFPLVILDGVNAFMMHEHLGSIPNMLIILDRSEYQDGINDKVLELRSVSSTIANFQCAIPVKFAPGIEISAYLIDA